VTQLSVEIAVHESPLGEGADALRLELDALGEQCLVESSAAPAITAFLKSDLVL